MQEGQVKRMQNKLNRTQKLFNATNKKLHKYREMAKVHHEIFELVKKEVGKIKYDSLVTEAYENLGIEKGSLKIRRKNNG